MIRTLPSRFSPLGAAVGSGVPKAGRSAMVSRMREQRVERKRSR